MRARMSAAIGLRFLRPFLLGVTAVLLLACSADEKSTEQTANRAEGITFFDVGARTVFSEALRDRLRKSLGPDAIEYRNTITLEFIGNDFLQRHFPVLYKLNRRLNTPAGERVEHDTVKLMYRYAVKENLPFGYVELVFSNTSGHPLYILIRSRKDLSAIIRTLKEKYGNPQIVDQSQGPGRFFFWRDRGDVLLVSVIPTWRGDEDCRIVIYYVDNIENLVVVEEKERRQKEEERRRAGEKIF